jgi:hypothetical protein
MSCKHTQELYRTRRKWWERLFGVRRAARCASCGGRVWFFSEPRRTAPPPRPHLTP